MKGKKIVNNINDFYYFMWGEEKQGVCVAFDTNILIDLGRLYADMETQKTKMLQSGQKELFEKLLEIKKSIDEKRIVPYVPCYVYLEIIEGALSKDYRDAECVDNEFGFIETYKKECVNLQEKINNLELQRLTASKAQVSLESLKVQIENLERIKKEGLKGYLEILIKQHPGSDTTTVKLIKQLECGNIEQVFLGQGHNEKIKDLALLYYKKNAVRGSLKVDHYIMAEASIKGYPLITNNTRDFIKQGRAARIKRVNEEIGLPTSTGPITPEEFVQKSLPEQEKTYLKKAKQLWMENFVPKTEKFPKPSFDDGNNIPNKECKDTIKALSQLKEFYLKNTKQDKLANNKDALILELKENYPNLYKAITTKAKESKRKIIIQDEKEPVKE